MLDMSPILRQICPVQAHALLLRHIADVFTALWVFYILLFTFPPGSSGFRAGVSTQMLVMITEEPEACSKSRAVFCLKRSHAH